MSIIYQLSLTRLDGASRNDHQTHINVHLSRDPRTIKAETVVKEILRTDTTDVYHLEDAEIIGPVNLKHRIVSRPIEIVRCTFIHDIDVRYCEFKQTVDLSDCIFDASFNSGDEIESHTIYRKDLICNRARFRGATSFNGACVEGSAYFQDAQFQFHSMDEDVVEVDFIGFQCAKTFEADRAVFEGGVSFNAFHCRDGLFHSIQCKNRAKIVSFRGASFGGNLEFQKKKDDDPPAVFKGGFDCIGVACGRKAIFSGVRFECSSDLVCSNDGKKHAVAFDHASFGWLMNCADAQFDGRVSLRAIQCDGDGYFNNAHFEYGQEMNEPGTQEPKNAVDFRFSHFGGNLDLREAQFKGSVNLGQVVIGGKLSLAHSSFAKAAKLYDANIKIFDLRDGKYSSDEASKAAQHGSQDEFPFKTRSLDLTSCTFERFHADTTELERELGFKLVEAQDPRTFSRDPYLQLERYYKNSGKEDAARVIHFKGHQDLRKNRKQPDGAIRWSTAYATKDLLLGLLTGWGLKTHRLAGICIFLIVCGTVFFSQEGALRPQANQEVVALASQPPERLGARLVERTLYSLDVFVPLDLGFSSKWEPTSLGVEAGIFIYTLMGWLLIPLLVASFAGVIKNDE